MTEVDCASTPQISVIIEGYNEAANIGREDQFAIEETLEALKKQDYRLDQVEVLVLGSRLQVAQWKEQFRDPGPFAALRVIELDGAQYYELKNRGAEVATGTILAFADADATPGPRWLSAIAEAIERGAAPHGGPLPLSMEGRGRRRHVIPASRGVDRLGLRRRPQLRQRNKRCWDAWP